MSEKVDFLYQRYCAMQARQNHIPMSFGEWKKAKQITEMKIEKGGKQK